MLKLDQSIKKKEEQKNRISDPLVFSQMFPKSMKDAYTSRHIFILIKYFFKNQCGFRKGFNVQHILLAIIEKMKTSRDNKQWCATILTAFDCVCFDLTW